MAKINISILKFYVFAAFILQGCSTLNPDTSLRGEFQTNEFIEKVSEIDLARARGIPTFRPGDKIDVTVHGIESLSGTFLVEEDGMVEFPLIKTINVLGKSTEGLRNELIKSYGSQYLQKPNISVETEQTILGSVVVDGAVNNPLVIELNKIIRLSEAIAMAQGVQEDSNSKEVYIVRDHSGKRKVSTVNLLQARLGISEDPNIIPGDVIYVPKSTSRVAFTEFLRTIPLINTAAIIALRR